MENHGTEPTELFFEQRMKMTPLTTHDIDGVTVFRNSARAGQDPSITCCGVCVVKAQVVTQLMGHSAQAERTVDPGLAGLTTHRAQTRPWTADPGKDTTM